MIKKIWLVHPEEEMCDLAGMADEWQAHPGATRPPHRIMPYADEDSVNHCDGCEPTILRDCLAAACNCGESACAAAAVASLGVECRAGDKSDCSDGPSLWRCLVQALCGETTLGADDEPEPKKQPEPTKDENDLNSHYHDHNLTCPYSGRSYPAQPYVPRPVPVSEPKAEPTKGGSQESETVKPMKLGTNVNPMPIFDDPQELLQWRPAFPRIDTMEFRPSDHRLSEYGCVPGTL